MRFFVSVSYNGARYSGWQRQPNATSIQEVLEDALGKALGSRIEVTGAGRTDAGVSAADYVAHFDYPCQIKEHGPLLYKINAILPSDIAVNSISQVSNCAHARFDATSRTYRYAVHTVKDPFAWHSHYCKFPLNVEEMNRAAAMLIGRHDFSSFEKTGADNKTSICAVSQAIWQVVSPGHLEFTITADRFLRNMVRAIVGTLTMVGAHKISVADFCRIIESKDRCKAGTSMPGHALYLWEITYPFPIL